jgi:hypothetical protein
MASKHPSRIEYQAGRPTEMQAESFGAREMQP